MKEILELLNIPRRFSHGLDRFKPILTDILAEGLDWISASVGLSKHLNV